MSEKNRHTNEVLRTYIKSVRTLYLYGAFMGVYALRHLFHSLSCRNYFFAWSYTYFFNIKQVSPLQGDPIPGFQRLPSLLPLLLSATQGDNDCPGWVW